jgi:succinoglycan biosynthesis transport protein ExoP
VNLRGYLDVLARRWLTAVVVAAVCLAASLGLSLTATPVYTASASLFFSLQTGNNANELAQGSTFTQNQMASYAALATTAAVLEPVIAELDLSTDPRQLARQIRASTPNETVVLEIRATSADRAQVAEIANSVAQQLTVAVDGLAPVDATGKATVSSAVVDPAEEPEFQTSPNTRRNLVVGVLLGLVLGALAALLRDALDTRVRTREDLAQLTELPLLASFDNPGEKDGRRTLVVASAPRGPAAEAFRSLRTAVQFSVRPGAPLALLVTSSRPGEGKSTVAANLALAMADAGLKVVLVDADLRRPSVAGTFDLVDSVGLTTVLIGQVDLDDALQSYGVSGLQVLTAGPLPPNPSELLATPDMAQLVERLGATHDVVVVDSPPLLAVTDATILSRLVDRTVVVSDASRSRRGHLSQSLGLLAQAGGRVAGLVFTHVRRTGEDVYGYEAWDEVAESGRGRLHGLLSRLRRRGGPVPATSMLVKLPPPGGPTSERVPSERVPPARSPVRR